jgi:hypothetical protein
MKLQVGSKSPLAPFEKEGYGILPQSASPALAKGEGWGEGSASWQAPPKLGTHHARSNYGQYFLLHTRHYQHAPSALLRLHRGDN